MDTPNAMFFLWKSMFWGVPGGPEAIVPFRPYVILYTKWDGTLHGSPPATALYRGPRSKRGGRTDTPKIQRAVNFHVAYGAPKIPPPHLLLRHMGALFRGGATLRHSTRLLSTESSPPFTSTHACTRRGMEEMSRFSTAPRLLFSHRTSFRTRTRNAFSLSHLVGFVRAKRKFPGGQAERPRAQSQTSKAAQGALRDVLRTPVHSRPGGKLQ